MINECSDGAANDFDISISTEKESNTEEREKKHREQRVLGLSVCVQNKLRSDVEFCCFTPATTVEKKVLKTSRKCFTRLRHTPGVGRGREQKKKEANIVEQKLVYLIWLTTLITVMQMRQWVNDWFVSCSDYLEWTSRAHLARNSSSSARNYRFINQSWWPAYRVRFGRHLSDFLMEIKPRFECMLWW